MKTVAILGSKGGVGKTALAHGLAYGAMLSGREAVMVHTDQRPAVKGERPYGLLDASSGYSQVTGIIREHHDRDGLMVVDGAGNRPHVDLWLTRTVDLVLVPVSNSAEDVRCALADLRRLDDPRVFLVVNRWPANALVRAVMQRYVEALPPARIAGRLAEVGAIRRFLDDGPWTPAPTRVRNLCRQLHRLTTDALARAAEARDQDQGASAVGG